MLIIKQGESVVTLSFQYLSKPVFLMSWYSPTTFNRLIEYHKRKLLIGHERDVICMKYVICTIFIQLDLCFGGVRTYCRI